MEFFPVKSLAAANMSFLLQAEKSYKESGKALGSLRSREIFAGTQAILRPTAQVT